MDSAPEPQLWPALDSLNQLASIPWSVNKSVLDVILKVNLFFQIRPLQFYLRSVLRFIFVFTLQIFQDGGSTELNVPQHPSVLPPVPLLQQDSDQAERINIAKARFDLRRRKGEMYSLWCDLLYRLSLANHVSTLSLSLPYYRSIQKAQIKKFNLIIFPQFRDKMFWLPHNMDFRGRVYPIPPHLNHLGSDLARSLLVFAQGKPLGHGGLDWLKIHVINLTGLKKRDPVSERLKYANENIDKILDSAENPLSVNVLR